MKPELPPDTLKVYSLVKRTEMMFTYGGASGAHNMGFGFYATREEAEHNRTLEILRIKDGDFKAEFYVFELEIPNPILK